jgi:septum formation inhibitor MinC
MSDELSEDLENLIGSVQSKIRLEDTNWKQDFNTDKITDIKVQFASKYLTWKVFEENVKRNQQALKDIKEDHHRLYIFVKNNQELIYETIFGSLESDEEHENDENYKNCQEYKNKKYDVSISVQ